MQHLGAPNLDHVRWVGGGSGAGKTTVSRLLAEHFGISYYSTDTTLSVHSERLPANDAPLLERFRRMSMDERWIRQDPVTMYTTFPWFHGEGFDLIVEDLRGMPTDRLILIEGFRLLPHLVQPHVSDPSHAVWLVPTPDFRQTAFSRRQAADAFWMQTSDPDQGLANLLERDRLFSVEVALDAVRYHFEVLTVDGTQTLDSLATELASRFGLQR
jgi:2-phosphoglycerate kinase